jgi:hypothetical protein
MPQKYFLSFPHPFSRFSPIVGTRAPALNVQFYRHDGGSYFFSSLGLIPKYFLNILLKCSGDS